MSSTLRRTLISVGCISLSACGLLFALMGLAMVKGIVAAVILLIWLAAIAALARMSTAWVRDIRLGPAYSTHAFLLGIASLLALPFAALFESKMVDHTGGTLFGLAAMTLFEAVTVSPAIALALHLNRFHSDSRE